MKILDQLDTFFATQKETEQKLTFLLPLIIIIFIVYYFIFPITDSMFNTSLNKNKQLNNSINSKKESIVRIRNSLIKIKKNERELKIKIKELIKTETIMHTLINKVKFLIFNLDRWAEIYNTIPKYVKNSNLLLLKLDNNLFLTDKKNNDKLVNLKMQITLEVAGSFPNVVKFINTFEARKDLVRIVSLKTDGMITSVTINIYGAQL